MPSKVDSLPRLEIGSMEEWEAWLEENNAKSEGAWLIFIKISSGRQPISQKEALEEALCFGWIDSQMRVLDDRRFIKLFTPRRKGSIWSQRNLDLCRLLIAEGRMRPEGSRAIDWGQEGWEKAFDTPPAELVQALQANEAAIREFESMTPKGRRMHIHYVMDAKQEEVRRMRIIQVVDLLSRGERLGIEHTYSKKTGAGKSVE